MGDEIGDIVKPNGDFTINSVTGILSGVYYAGPSAKKPREVAYVTLGHNLGLTIKLIYSNKDEQKARAIREHIGEKAYRVIYGPGEDMSRPPLEDKQQLQKIYGPYEDILKELGPVNQISQNKRAILGPTDDVISTITPRYNPVNFLSCVGSEVEMKLKYENGGITALSLNDPTQTILFSKGGNFTHILYKK